MASKKKTTFAKLNREQKLREKRAEKQMRKDARKLAAANGESVATMDAHDETLDTVEADEAVAADEAVETVR